MRILSYIRVRLWEIVLSAATKPTYKGGKSRKGALAVVLLTAVAIAAFHAYATPALAALACSAKEDPSLVPGFLSSYAPHAGEGWDYVSEAWPDAGEPGRLIDLAAGTLLAAIGASALLVRRRSREDALFGADTARDSAQSSGRVEFDERALGSTSYAYNPDGGRPEYGGMVYGYSMRRHLYYISRPEAHTITAAPPGAGKSTGHVIPAMQSFIRSRRSSVVCIDPQLEIYAATADYARDNGCKVIRLDYRQTEASDLYNEIAEVHRVYEAGLAEWRELVESASAASARGDLAEAAGIAKRADHALRRAEGRADSLARDAAAVMIPKRPSDGESSFWKESGQHLLAAGILLVATYRQSDWAADSPAPAEPYPEQRTLESVLWILKELGAEVREKKGDKVVTYTPLEVLLDSLRPSHPAVGEFSVAKISKGQTLSGMCSTVASAIAGIIDVETNAIGYDTDIDFEALASEKTVVYVVPPGEKPSRGAHTAVFVVQMYQALVAVAQGNGGRLPLKVQVVFEEFGGLQYPIPNIDAMLGECRKYGINFHFVVQDFGQIDKWYEPAVARNILNLCNAKILLKTNDEKTAKLLCERIGKHTVEEDEYSGSQSTTAVIEANVSSRHRSVQTDYLTQADILGWNPEWGALVWRDKLDRRQSPLERLLRRRDKVEVACYPSAGPERQPALRIVGAYPEARLKEKKAAAAAESKIDARIVSTPWTAEPGGRARRSQLSEATERALAESAERREGASAAEGGYTRRWVSEAAGLVREEALSGGDPAALADQLVSDLKERSKQETALANRLAMNMEKAAGLGTPYSCRDEAFVERRSGVGRAWIAEARRMLDAEACVARDGPGAPRNPKPPGNRLKETERKQKCRN